MAMASAWSALLNPLLQRFLVMCLKRLTIRKAWPPLLATLVSKIKSTTPCLSSLCNRLALCLPWGTGASRGSTEEVVGTASSTSLDNQQRKWANKARAGSLPSACKATAKSTTFMAIPPPSAKTQCLVKACLLMKERWLARGPMRTWPLAMDTGTALGALPLKGWRSGAMAHSACQVPWAWQTKGSTRPAKSSRADVWGPAPLSVVDQRRRSPSRAGEETANSGRAFLGSGSPGAALVEGRKWAAGRPSLPTSQVFQLDHCT
eukprot:11228316-Lingulodinium_polyedra.AAC.1